MACDMNVRRCEHKAIGIDAVCFLLTATNFHVTAPQQTNRKCSCCRQQAPFELFLIQFMHAKFSEISEKKADHSVCSGCIDRDAEKEKDKEGKRKENNT
jgi:hypothetical protein